MAHYKTSKQFDKKLKHVSKMFKAKGKALKKMIEEC